MKFLLLAFLSFSSFALEQLPNGRSVLIHVGNGGCYTTEFYVKTGDLSYNICLNNDGYFVDSKGNRFTPNFGDWEDTGKTMPKKYYKFESQVVVSEGKLEATLSQELDKTSLTQSQKSGIVSGVKSGIGF